MALLSLLAACAPQPNKPVVTPETVEVAPTKPAITPDQLLGQGEPWVVAKLGQPKFARADLDASIWQYKSTACVLNVFLYADLKDANAPARVLHFDARDVNGQNTDRAACLASLPLP